MYAVNRQMKDALTKNTEKNSTAKSVHPRQMMERPCGKAD